MTQTATQTAAQAAAARTHAIGTHATGTHATGTHGDRRALGAQIAPFTVPSVPVSVWQVASTFALYVVLTAAMYATYGVSAWLTLALAVPAGGMVVRLFIIQHDCGHGSFFRSKRANGLVGRFVSAMTYTPYAFWKRQHALHHASFNNLDRRDFGLDLYSNCSTLREYLALPRRDRLLYRALRHPLITQLLLPPLVFLFVYRVPFDTPRDWTRERTSVHLANAAVFTLLGSLMLAFGVVPVLVVQVPVVVVASVVGVWLFSVQHRFEEAQWARQADWNLVSASLDGSSYLRLPKVLQWFTGNIGFHHIHHLAARVPNYRLQACHQHCPELASVTTLDFWDAMRAPSFALWDEDLGHMVRFPRAREFRAFREAALRGAALPRAEAA